MYRSSLSVICLSALPFLTGCGFFLPGGALNSTSPANEEVSAKSESDALERHRDAARAKPGDYGSASKFAAFAASVQKKSNTSLHKATLVDEAIGYLEAVDDPEFRHSALADKGALLKASGDDAVALTAYQASFDLKPSLKLVPGMLELLKGEPERVATTCEAIRTNVDGQAMVFRLMEGCSAAGDDLAWAGADDRDAYQAEVEAAAKRRAEADAARRREEEARRLAEEERRKADRDAKPTASNGGSSGSGGTSKPERYSARISVHSSCDKTVKVFRGKVNGRYTGGGTTGSHSSNSTSSYSLSGDDEICLMGENGRDILSCSKPSNGARLEITKSCSGFTRR